MSDNPVEAIYKVGAIIVDDSKLLVVRKRTADNRSEYIIPGGRREGEETNKQTLERELDEELGVALLGMRHFGSFDELAVFENIPIHMEVYFAEIHGNPSPHSEIKEYIWIDKNYEQEGIKLGSVLAMHVVPGLVEAGLM